MLTLTAWRVLPSLNRAVGAIVNIRANQPMGMPCLEYMEQLKAVPQLDVESQDSDFAIKDGIRLDNIYYRYPGAEQDSLKGVTLDIPKGASVGIIGKSGAGKSTLINVLSGLLQPASGRILVDGREMPPGQVLTYRQSIGYVPQNPYLMAGTVAENIAFSSGADAGC
jgi:ABC-type bacteriocin/lantibiotic exporter with double-glycine peptidase domain